MLCSDSHLVCASTVEGLPEFEQTRESGPALPHEHGAHNAHGDLRALTAACAAGGQRRTHTCGVGNHRHVAELDDRSEFCRSLIVFFKVLCTLKKASDFLEGAA